VRGTAGAALDKLLTMRRKVASIAWISAVHSSSSGGGGGLVHVSSGSQRGSASASLLGNRRGLLLLRGVLGFGAGSTLYWTVGSHGRSIILEA
jgi:hypothetical protein